MPALGVVLIGGLVSTAQANELMPDLLPGERPVFKGYIGWNPDSPTAPLRNTAFQSIPHDIRISHDGYHSVDDRYDARFAMTPSGGSSTPR